MSLLKRTLKPSDQDPTLITSFNLNYLSKAPSPNIFTVRIRASIYELKGDTNIQSISEHVPNANIQHKIVNCFPIVM
jgi:hypothetical protein